mgnify:CR=1 FL=1
MLVKDNKNIDFGYKIVKKKDKQNLVNSVFNSVADKYDLMNDITSLGIHREWKNNLINWMAPQNPKTPKPQNPMSDFCLPPLSGVYNNNK